MALISKIPAIIAGLPGATDRGVHRAAGMVHDLATQLAPEDTGALKASGRVEPEEPNGGGTYQVIFGGGNSGVDYALYVEFGNDNPNYPAQPFLTPAAREIKPVLEIKAELLALIDRNRV